MRKLYLNILCLSSFLLLSLPACYVKSEYQKLEDEELASGKVVNDLFLGFELGMTSKEFYDKCWELNKEELLRQTPANNAVEYRPKELNFPGRMTFYPRFHEDQIYELPVRVFYDGWSPWNKEQSVEVLHEDVKELMEDWFGEGFITVEHPNKGKAYVRVDGNRRISILADEAEVKVIMTDLRVSKKLPPKSKPKPKQET
ncbi:MAG: hypothetical protein AAF206_16955 [Bacteroidota bacterium]